MTDPFCDDTVVLLQHNDYKIRDSLYNYTLAVVQLLGKFLFIIHVNVAHSILAL